MPSAMVLWNETRWTSTSPYQTQIDEEEDRRGAAGEQQDSAQWSRRYRIQQELNGDVGATAQRKAAAEPRQPEQAEARRLLGPIESIIEEVAGEDTEQHDAGHQRSQPGDEKARQVQQRAIEGLEHDRPWELGSGSHATIGRGRGRDPRRGRDPQ